MNAPRVAFFTDSFHEVNGVARTSREFARFAQTTGRPFLSVHPGKQNQHRIQGAFETLELANSFAVVPLDTNLLFDLLFLRHYGQVVRRVAAFRADLVHVTGPGHTGLLGALAAYRLGIPLVASWHTNLHEFARRRLEWALPFFPQSTRSMVGSCAEACSFQLVAWFYRLARILFAPNPELVELLARSAHRPTHLMVRGIDTELFTPERRVKQDDTFTIGFVGRLTPEKNVGVLPQIEDLLRAAGLRKYRFLVIGDGGERRPLEQRLRQREMPGYLHGEALADAYARMDAFLFPSETDTFGNVGLDALASGVPAVVSGAGGPKFIVRDGSDGFVANTAAEYAQHLLRLAADESIRTHMAHAARQRAQQFSWEAVFSDVYQEYDAALASGILKPARHIRREQRLSGQTYAKSAVPRRVTL